MERTDIRLDGHAGTLRGSRWRGSDTRYVVVLVHGYGEHIRRYDYVASRLVTDGAVVYGNDHVGHGESDGEPVVVQDFESVVDDTRRVVNLAKAENPALPVVMIGHSMGGMIAARYAQRYAEDLRCLVLSGPVIGSWAAVDDLRGVSEIPYIAIDPDTLSRDPAIGEAYSADPLVWHGAFKRPTLDALDACLDSINRAGTLDVPVILLHGEEDQLVPIAATLSGWSTVGPTNGAKKTYPGARHEIFNETNKDEVLDDVLAFINQYI